MGLKCSVLGHTYGETTVEREREEQGSEVVITIQERETCERCGDTRIVSENKEVTAIETPSDIASDLVGEEADAETTTEPDPAAGADPAEAAGDETGSTDGWDSVDDPVEAPGDAGLGDDAAAEDATDPSADDAEIIDDTAETETAPEDERVDVELDEPTTTVEVPDAEREEPVTEDETDPEKDDGLILGEEATETATDDRQPGEWPEEPGDDGDDWPPETLSADSDDADPEPAGETAVTVPEGEFRCPECGFTTEVESTSLRAGDFCPECHKGALINRREE